MPGSALEAVAGYRSGVLGRDRSPGRLPCSLQGLSSSPFSHPGIVSDVPGRLSSGSSLAARGHSDGKCMSPYSNVFCYFLEIFDYIYTRFSRFFLK